MPKFSIVRVGLLPLFFAAEAGVDADVVTLGVVEIGLGGSRSEASLLSSSSGQSWSQPSNRSCNGSSEIFVLIKAVMKFNFKTIASCYQVHSSTLLATVNKQINYYNTTKTL